MAKGSTRIIDHHYFDVDVEIHGQDIKLSQAGGNASRNPPTSRDTILLSREGALELADKLKEIARG